MAGPFTVDASVFLNAFNPGERGHETSRQFLARLHQDGTPIIAPALLLPEVAGAIARGHQKTRIARQFAVTLSRLSNLFLVSLDVRLAQRAVEAAARYRLRGSDAVYVAVAEQFGSALITLDQEQQHRASKVVPTRLPGEIVFRS